MPNKPKPIDKTKTLDHARKTGDLEKFIKEHEDDEAGDLDKLDKALKTPPKKEAQPKAKKVVHASDCAMHNAPALKAGACDCGAKARG